MARPKKEKRIFPRKPIRTQVVFENEDSEGILYFFSTDISVGGIFIESDIPIRVGTQVFLRFNFDGEARPVQATGEVVRAMKDHNAGKSSKMGIGIRFLYLHPFDKERIEHYLAKD